MFGQPSGRAASSQSLGCVLPTSGSNTRWYGAALGSNSRTGSQHQANPTSLARPPAATVVPRHALFHAPVVVRQDGEELTGKRHPGKGRCLTGFSTLVSRPEGGFVGPMPAHPSVLLLGINVTEKQRAIVVVVSGVVMWATSRVVQAVREQSGMSTPTPHEACVSRRCPLSSINSVRGMAWSHSGH